MTKLVVTSTNIDNGLKGNASRCPVALALRREYPDAAIARINVLRSPFDKPVSELPKAQQSPYYVEVHFSTSKRFMQYSLPQQVCDFISSFDYGGEVEPFEVELSWCIYPNLINDVRLTKDPASIESTE